MGNNNGIVSKYPAQGFVESLIAILVTGVACVVLLQIASNTLSEVASTEVNDLLTQEAVKGQELLKFYVEQYNFNAPTGTTNLLPISNPSTDIGRCVYLKGDLPSPTISSKDSPVCSMNNGSIVPSQCLSSVDDAAIDEDKLFFRILCIDQGTSSGVLVAKIFTGQTACRDETSPMRQSIGNRTGCNLYQLSVIHRIRST